MGLKRFFDPATHKRVPIFFCVLLLIDAEIQRVKYIMRHINPVYFKNRNIALFYSIARRIAVDHFGAPKMRNSKLDFKFGIRVFK